MLILSCALVFVILLRYFSVLNVLFEEMFNVAVDMNMNVLIVDDYTTMLRIIQKLLKQLGFSNIDEATDDTTAFE